MKKIFSHILAFIYTLGLGNTPGSEAREVRKEEIPGLTILLIAGPLIIIGIIITYLILYP